MGLDFKDRQTILKCFLIIQWGLGITRQKFTRQSFPDKLSMTSPQAIRLIAVASVGFEQRKKIENDQINNSSQHFDLIYLKSLSSIFES